MENTEEVKNMKSGHIIRFKMWEMPDKVVNEFLQLVEPNLLFLRFELNLQAEQLQPGQEAGFYYRKGAIGTEPLYFPFSNPYWIKYCYEKGYDITDALDMNINALTEVRKENKRFQEIIGAVVHIVSKDVNSDRGKMKKLTEFINDVLEIDIK